MRGGDAEHRRAAQLMTIADHMERAGFARAR
jgi:hypothetical protein